MLRLRPTHALLLTLPVLAQAPGIRNPDFADAAPGQVPPGWSVSKPSQEAGFKADVQSDGKLPGKRCVVLQNPDPAAKAFGNLMQKVDATPYRGKRVRLRTLLRLEEKGSWVNGALWLRVDRPNGERGFFDNMAGRAVTATAWTAAEIVGDVEPDAKDLALGVMLSRGGARLRIAPLSLEILGDTPARTPEGPRALTDAGLRNLEALARSFNVVRFFHPADAAARADWNRLAREGVRAVEGATSNGDLAARLQAFLAPYAPSARILEGKEAPAPLAKPAGAAQAVRWNHLGFGMGQPEGIYRSTREFLPLESCGAKGWKDPAVPSTFPLGGGLRLALATTCFADAQGATLPRMPEDAPAPKAGALPEPTVSKGEGDDRATRLGDVVLAWGVFQHFYPYFDVTGTDWDGELSRALRAAAGDRDGEAFAHTLGRMLAALKDGHGSVVMEGTRARLTPELDLVMLEGWPVVRFSRGTAAAVPPGSRILTVDGEPVEAVLARLRMETAAATEGWMNARLAGKCLAGTASSVRIQWMTVAGVRGEAVLPRADQAEPMEHAGKPPQAAELRPGIWYVDLDRISNEAFAKVLPSLAKAKGVVFDLRGYPRMSPTFLQHLTDRPLTSAFWNVPRILQPDREGVAWETSGRWNLKPKGPRIQGKVAFLTGGGAISYAESCLGIVEAYKLAEIVGEPSAGTNGNVNPIRLPGGYTLGWTGMQVIKHDGTRHHGVGIRPTLPVVPTRRGLAEGRDEVLDKGLEAVSR